MNEVKRIAWFLLGVLVAAVPLLSWAGGVVVYDGTAGTLTPAGDLAKATAPGSSATRTYTGSAGAGGPEVLVKTPARHVVTAGRVPVTIDNEIRQKVLAKGIGKLAVGAMRGTVQGIVIGTAIDAAFDAAGIECDLTGCRVAVVPENCPGGMCEINATAGPGPAYEIWYGNYTQHATCTPACQAKGGVSCGNWGTVGQGRQNEKQCLNGQGNQIEWVPRGFGCTVGNATVTGYGASATATCASVTAYSCPAGQGWTLSGTKCQRLACASNLVRNASGQCVAPASKTDDEAATITGPYFSPADAEALVREVDQSGQAAQIEAEPQSVTGPASVSSPETTSQQTTGTAPNQTTVTVSNQTIVNNTYNQSTWTYNVVNQTTTKDAQGNVVDSKEEDVDEAVAVTDAAMPEVPKLYDRKYPDGMQGVWNTQKANLTAGGLAGLQSVFVPNISGGQCPTWTISANIGPHMNFGSGVISPPCWIWDAIKAIFVITALFLARRLIFGG